MLRFTSGMAAGFVVFAGSALAQPAADPLANLSRDVSVVLNPGPNAQILLTEDDHGVATTRTLVIGDEYADGWRIKTITGTSVTLTKDDKTRTMAILGRHSGPAPAIPAAPPAPSVSASNAGARPAASPPLSPAMARAQLDANIAVGNVEQVKLLGGTSDEIARATVAQAQQARTANQAAQAANAAAAASVERQRMLQQKGAAPPRPAADRTPPNSARPTFMWLSRAPGGV